MQLPKKIINIKYICIYIYIILIQVQLNDKAYLLKEQTALLLKRRKFCFGSSPYVLLTMQGATTHNRRACRMNMLSYKQLKFSKIVSKQPLLKVFIKTKVQHMNKEGTYTGLPTKKLLLKKCNIQLFDFQRKLITIKFELRLLYFY